MKKKFLDVVIQEKCSVDWRAFCHCIDEEDNKWELRGYGKNILEAVKDVYEKYLDSSERWNFYGYKI